MKINYYSLVFGMAFSVSAIGLGLLMLSLFAVANYQMNNNPPYTDYSYLWNTISSFCLTTIGLYTLFNYEKITDKILANDETREK